MSYWPFDTEAIKKLSIRKDVKMVQKLCASGNNIACGTQAVKMKRNETYHTYSELSKLANDKYTVYHKR